MEAVAQALQLLDSFGVYHKLMNNATWKDEPGIKYTDAAKYVRNYAKPITKVYGDAIFSGVEFEAVRVIDGLRPHYHEHTDSVIYCITMLGSAEAYEAYFEFGDKPLWLPLDARALIQIPRGVPHGFRLRGERKKTTRDLMLIAATFPPVAEGDTIYL